MAQETVETADTLTEWERIGAAIIQVESGGRVDAVCGDCAGCFQISPIYVEEVNRITGKTYTLADRFDECSSWEMFEAMNERYNPERTLEGACRVHNPKGGEVFIEKVRSAYELLKCNNI